jgi:hypothetical protein
MQMKIKLSILFLFFFNSHSAQVELKVHHNKNKFTQGDTLVSQCIFNYNDAAYAASTLHVWIENTSGTKRWKYRFPLINGKCLFNLVIDKNLGTDTYAINYLVQPQFFTVKAHVKNYNNAMNGINMLLISKSMANHSSSYTPDSEGNFKIGRILFSDTAQFTFTPNTKKGGELWMNIETPIDSSFTPLARQTVIIELGTSTIPKKEDYKFDSVNFFTKGKELAEIVVVADVRAQKLETFQKKNVSTRFKAYSRDINGLYNEEMMRSPDIFVYLRKQVTSLEIISNPYGQGYIILRRGAPVEIFLDEVPASSFDLNFLHPGDVALIKIYDPGFGPTMGYGGALAIYTKKGEDLETALKQRSVYQIFGYSSEISIWK